MTVDRDFSVEFPLFGFSHCRDVVAAISRAGALGVLGAASMSPDQLDIELTWIDEQVNGAPYGLDVIIPAKFEETEGSTGTDLYELYVKSIPETHWQFVDRVLTDLGVPPMRDSDFEKRWVPFSRDRARDQIQVGLNHKVSMVVSALGTPPTDLIELAHDHGVRVGAMAGKVRHAERHVEAGVDIVIAQGSEAGGHIGDVSTMVLTPDVVDAVSPVPVLAAGGIASGRQMAAARALGAGGFWTGSVWLTTIESDTHPDVMERYLKARSDETVVAFHNSGKSARKLRTVWTDAWLDPSAPPILPSPLQGILIARAEARMRQAQRWDLVDAPVGQVVGRMNQRRTVRNVVFDLMEEYTTVMERMTGELGS